MIESAHSCLPENCQVMCTLADSTLMAMMKTISNGTITLRAMEGIYEKKDQVEKLCGAASKDYKLEDVKSLLKTRNDECTAFKRYKAILASFCREIRTTRLRIQG